MGFDDGVGRAKAQPMSVATRHMLRKYMCVMLCAAVLVSTATAALAWTFGAALSHDPHMTHKNSASLPKIGQHSLSKGAGAGTRSGVHSRGAHGRTSCAPPRACRAAPRVRTHRSRPGGGRAINQSPAAA